MIQAVLENDVGVPAVKLGPYLSPRGTLGAASPGRGEGGGD